MQRFLLIFIMLFCLSPALNLFAQTPQNPLKYENSVYISEQGVFRFELHDLSIKWRALSTLQTFEPLIAGNLVVVGSTQGLYALDINSGKIIWHVEQGHTLFSPAVFQNHLYAGSEHGVLYDISLTDGSINWTARFNGWIYSPVVMAEYKQLWTGGQGHQAVAVDLFNGELKHQIPLSQEVIFSPVKVSLNTVGYNLFNGSSVMIDISKASISNLIAGSVQAKNLLDSDDDIFRSSRDGSLTVFSKDSEKIEWQDKYFDAGLTLYPGLKNRLLLSDEGEWLGVFDISKKKLLWNKKITGNWFLPVQLNHKEILVFYRNGLNLNNPVAVIVDTHP